MRRVLAAPAFRPGVVALVAVFGGCSSSDAPPIDQKATMQPAQGGPPTASKPGQDVASKHPKLD